MARGKVVVEAVTPQELRNHIDPGVIALARHHLDEAFVQRLLDGSLTVGRIYELVQEADAGEHRVRVQGAF
jgi:hypothetical protein